MSQPTPIDVFRGDLRQMHGEFALVLPEGVTPEKFTRVVMTAVQSSDQVKRELGTPDGRRAILAAAMRCAQDGLMPDNREAAFVVYGGKPQYMPMIGGVRKKIMGTGLLSGMPAHVVYENDHFVYELGDNERLEHRPVLKDRGAIIAAYAIAIFKDGYREREVMTTEDIEKVRACSKAKNGPWSAWWDQMAIKTVVKRLAKRLPLDDAAASLIETDNEQFDGQTIDISLAVPDTTEFDRMAGDDLGNPRFIAFLAEVAQTNGYTVEQVKHEAAKDFEAFMTAFRSKEAKALDAGPIVLDMPAQAQPEEVRASTEKEQAQQSAAQADPRATVLCPNRQNSDGDSIEVLASVCATCADRDGCPALQ